jgi:GNAT superfamily N-acetyltransferase
LLRRLRLEALRDAPAAFSEALNEVERRRAEAWAECAARRAGAPAEACFFAERKAEPTGMVGALALSPATFLMVALWVRPGARGAGIGRALIAAVEGWSRAAGAAELGAWVTADNEPALALYLGRGFVRTGASRPCETDPGRREVETRKALTPGGTRAPGRS